MPDHNNNVEEKSKNAPLETYGFGYRHIVVMLSFCAILIGYLTRVNLSVAIVMMTQAKPTPVANVSANSSMENSSISYGEFSYWDKSLRGHILGAFFYGYALTQFPGGFLSQKFGPKYVLGLGILLCSLFTLLIPFAARLSPYALIATRVLVGLAQGVMIPSCHNLLAMWCPKMERSKLSSFTYSGIPMGQLIGMPLTAYLCRFGFAGGWPSAFYVIGGVGCVWFLFWLYNVYDHPESHPRISQGEIAYIKGVSAASQSFPKKRFGKANSTPVKIPWLAIFTSLPFFATVVANFAYTWLTYLLLTTMPIFYSEVLNFSITSNGLVSALPYLLFWIFSNVSGFLADFMRSRLNFSTRSVRKIFNTVAFVSSALTLGLASYSTQNQILTVIFIALALSSMGISYSGFFVNHLDIAPAFAGILFGIANTIGSVPGFLAPLSAAKITAKHSDAHHWRYVFAIAIFLNLASALFYIFTASGEEQYWASVNYTASSPADDDDDELYREKSLLNNSSHDEAQNKDESKPTTRPLIPPFEKSASTNI